MERSSRLGKIEPRPVEGASGPERHVEIEKGARNMVEKRIGNRLWRTLAVALLALTFVVGAFHTPMGADARTSRNVKCATMWQNIVGLMDLSQASLDAGNQAEAEYYAIVAMGLAEDYAASCMA
jgi:hypothetical protein